MCIGWLRNYSSRWKSGLGGLPAAAALTAALALPVWAQTARADAVFVCTNTSAISALAKALVIDGGIIILHDTRERGPRTVTVLDELIPYLKRKGYKFALLPGLAVTK